MKVSDVKRLKFLAMELCAKIMGSVSIMLRRLATTVCALKISQEKCAMSVNRILQGTNVTLAKKALRVRIAT